MDMPNLQTPDWYKGMTLMERIASLRTAQNSKANLEVDAELAGLRMRCWQSQAPFATDAFFAQRLATDGITEDELFHILGEPIRAVCDRSLVPPAWLAGVVEMFSYPCSSKSFSLLEALRGHDRGGFLDAIEPFISQGCDKLHQGILALSQVHTELPFDPSTVEAILFENLLEPLSIMIGRTMVLELNVARLQGLLQGDSPEERLQSFLKHLRRRDIVLALLQEYPVLARQLSISVNNWAAFSLEFIRHLCADWEAIKITFNQGNDPGVLARVYGGMGDGHRGGRAVLIASFSSGFQVVYKPRSLSIDVHFQELIKWLNERGQHPPFRALKVLDRGNHGWEEFVAAFDCTSSEEVRRFYERQGGYLAVLYALEAADFHAENLIAAGEHPILLDLEALFHPRLEGIKDQQSDGLASTALLDSVMSVGLLPQRQWANAESEGIDTSGLGAVKGQFTPYGIPQWEATWTDEMRLARKRMEMPGHQNRPVLNGDEIDVLDYAEAIIYGFTTVYRLLLKHRNELLSDDGPLAGFTEDEVRIIFRPTRTYDRLLFESFHPDVLRNALDRERLFDWLWATVRYFPHLAKVITAEREDLMNNDIPIFTTRPGSQHLWSSTNEQINDFFDESGMALAQRRVQRLSEDDLTQQLWVIRASLATMSMGEDSTRWPTYHLVKSQAKASREQLLAAARAIGDRLEALALRGDHDASWIGLMPLSEGHWSLMPLGMDFYDGLAGVVLFMAHLGDVTSDERYTALSRAALVTLRGQVERNQSFIKSIGGFNGWGGVIYTLAHLGALWVEPTMLAEAEALVTLLPSLIKQDEHLDIITGAAGCIGSLLSLHRCAPSGPALAAAIQCGDRLISTAQPMEQGIGWIPKSGGIKPLTGFSHGAAGMAWALLELAAVTGEERFRRASVAAISYERSLFSPNTGNWPDLREMKALGQVSDAQEYSFMIAWCHGAPGIGLARLRSLSHLDDAATRAEIDAALQTTLSQGFGFNHSLCHGDLGNIELLLQAGRVLNDPQWRMHADRLAFSILDSIDRHGWLCGIPLGVESPGLMTGLAGIGYQLLRLAEPARVPSVLTLEPPIPAM